MQSYIFEQPHDWAVKCHSLAQFGPADVYWPCRRPPEYTVYIYILLPNSFQPPKERDHFQSQAGFKLWVKGSWPALLLVTFVTMSTASSESIFAQQPPRLSEGICLKMAPPSPLHSLPLFSRMWLPQLLSCQSIHMLSVLIQRAASDTQCQPLNWKC